MILQWLAPQFVPCDEFHDILESVFRDLYTIDDTTRLVMYGGTLMNTERNVRTMFFFVPTHDFEKDRSMMTLLILYCFDPYISLRTLSSQFSSFLWVWMRLLLDYTERKYHRLICDVSRELLENKWCNNKTEEYCRFVVDSHGGEWHSVRRPFKCRETSSACKCSKLSVKNAEI